MACLPDHLEHDGLVLRRWTDADAAALGAAIAANREHLRPYMPWIAAEPLTVDDRRALFREWEDQRLAGGDVVLGIFERGVVVGGTGLHRRIGPGGLEIGYWVAADHLGKHIAARASAALTDAAFDQPDIDRVEIRHDLSNTYSRNVPASLGFVLVGRDAPNRDTRAPSETGVDLVWRTTKATWSSVSTARSQ